MKIKKQPTSPPKWKNKKFVKKQTKALIKKIYEFQRIMYAQGKYSLLIVLQWMDASGKWGVIKDVFSHINPSRIRVHGWKKPTSEEAAHDFLRRIHKATPARGMIHIFDRSYYEDILVPSVYKTFPKKIIERRYDHINNFERLLKDNNTHVVKFFLNISKDVQKDDLKARLQKTHKYWKHNDGDWESRKRWDKFMKTYEKIFKRCNKPEWNVVWTDENRWKNYQVARRIVEEFEKMKLKWPDLDTGKFN